MGGCVHEYDDNEEPSAERRGDGGEDTRSRGVRLSMPRLAATASFSSSYWQGENGEGEGRRGKVIMWFMGSEMSARVMQILYSLALPPPHHTRSHHRQQQEDTFGYHTTCFHAAAFCPASECEPALQVTRTLGCNASCERDFVHTFRPHALLHYV